MALAEKPVPRAGIHIYKHAILFPFYFVQLGENTLTTYQCRILRFQEQKVKRGKSHHVMYRLTRRGGGVTEVTYANAEGVRVDNLYTQVRHLHPHLS